MIGKCVDSGGAGTLRFKIFRGTADKPGTHQASILSNLELPTTPVATTCRLLLSMLISCITHMRALFKQLKVSENSSLSILCLK